MKREIPKSFTWRLIALFILGGLQGAVGWFMVISGIEGSRTEVSPYRLSAHLLFALFLFSALIWTALDLRRLSQNPAAKPARLTGWGALALIVLFVQLLLGAWVAGLRAGVVAGGGWFNWNAWPLMQGRLFPDGVDWAAGVLWAAEHDPFLIHFLHRWWAWVVVALLVLLARRVRGIERRASVAVHSAFGTQILLGIATVWSGVALWLAVLHQAVGALLVAATTWAVHALGRR